MVYVHIAASSFGIAALKELWRKLHWEKTKQPWIYTECASSSDWKAVVVISISFVLQYTYKDWRMNDNHFLPDYAFLRISSDIIGPSVQDGWHMVLLEWFLSPLVCILFSACLHFNDVEKHCDFYNTYIHFVTIGIISFVRGTLIVQYILWRMVLESEESSLLIIIYLYGFVTTLLRMAVREQNGCY